jgi:hypothetical protein
VKPRNREINIFNLSMLDVISGAMAAFLIIVVILLPYYKKEKIDYQAIIVRLQQTIAQLQSQREAAEAQAEAAREQLAQAREQLAQAQADAQQQRERAEALARQQQSATAQAEAAREQLAQAQADAQQQRERAEALARELAKTFLVLYVRWDTHDDVDLHLFDPSGAEFSYQNKIIAGRPGELSEDNVNGPGNEVWEIRDAPPGDYQVYVKLYAVKDRRKPVVVKGRFFHRDGSGPFPEVSLTQEKQFERVAVLRIDSEGNVTLQ